VAREIEEVPGYVEADCDQRYALGQYMVLLNSLNFSHHHKSGIQEKD